MHWLLKVTLSFVFLALAACGREESPDSRGVSTGDRASDGRPEPDPAVPDPAVPDPATPSRAEPDEGADGESSGKPGGWPALDEDPSRDEPTGSGDWCGTDVRRGFGSRLGWQGPGEGGVWRRVTSSLRTVDVDLTEFLRKKHELRQRVKAAKTPAAKAKAEAELAALRKQPRITFGRGYKTQTTQFGVEHDGVFYESKAGENLTDFLARARKAAAEGAEKRKAAREKKAASK